MGKKDKGWRRNQSVDTCECDRGVGEVEESRSWERREEKRRDLGRLGNAGDEKPKLGAGRGVKRGEQVRVGPAAPLRTGYPARKTHLSLPTPSPRRCLQFPQRAQPERSGGVSPFTKNTRGKQKSCERGAPFASISPRRRGPETAGSRERRADVSHPVCVGLFCSTSTIALCFSSCADVCVAVFVHSLRCNCTSQDKFPCRDNKVYLTVSYLGQTDSVLKVMKHPPLLS